MQVEKDPLDLHRNASPIMRITQFTFVGRRRKIWSGGMDIKKKYEGITIKK